MDLIVSFFAGFPNLLFGVAAFLVLIVVVVFVHEFGHFIIARLNGVRVEVFSIGMGPELFGWNDRYGTRWRVSLVPLGGYVKFFGDVDEASGQARDDLTEDEKRVAFPHKKLWQRASIVFAGPAFNFVFAILIFAAFFLMLGRPVVPAIVGQVMENSAAASVGLVPGDRIVSIQDVRVNRFSDVQRLVPLYGHSDMTIVIERDGHLQTLVAHPEIAVVEDALGNKQATPRLGVAIDTGTITYDPMSVSGALAAASEETWNITSSTLVVLKQIITGTRSADELGGPIRIAQASAQAAQVGIRTYVWLIALLSVNLGLINLLPIPPLDGGHLLFHSLEGALRRPLGERLQDIGMKLGLLFVFGVMIFATWNDITRLFQS